MRRLALLLLALASVPAPAVDSFAHKIALRTDNGLLWNHGDAGGSTSSLGGLNLDYLYFFSPYFAVGAGYQINYDISRSNVPLHGLDFLARYYLYGLGTRVRLSATDMVTEARDTFAVFVSFGTRQNNLVVREPLASADSTVTSWNINQGIGADYRLSRGFDITAEMNVGLFSFADENRRYRLGSALFKLGLNFLW